MHFTTAVLQTQAMVVFDSPLIPQRKHMHVQRLGATMCPPRSSCFASHQRWAGAALIWGRQQSAAQLRV